MASDPNSIDMNPKFSGETRAGKDFSPLKWSNYYDKMEYMDNVTINIDWNYSQVFI